MAAYVAVIATSIAFVGFVIGASLLTINKGYSYKHTIDELPDEETDNEKEKENQM